MRVALITILLGIASGCSLRIAPPKPPQYAFPEPARSARMDPDASLPDTLYLNADSSRYDVRIGRRHWARIYDPGHGYQSGFEKIDPREFSKTASDGDWKVGQVINVQLTAYPSHPNHTDSTPHETSSGTRTRWGIVAHNGLPFGTRVRFTNLFGGKIFTVEDRMNQRYDHSYADVWWPDHQGAHDFGVKRNAEMEIVSLP